ALVNPREGGPCSSSGTLRRPMHAPLIINCRRGIPQFWGLTSRSSSRITEKAPHGTESASAPTLARPPKGCAPASARRAEAASSNGIESQTLTHSNWVLKPSDSLDRAEPHPP